MFGRAALCPWLAPGSLSLSCCRRRPKWVGPRSCFTFHTTVTKLTSHSKRRIVLLKSNAFQWLN